MSSDFTTIPSDQAQASFLAVKESERGLRPIYVWKTGKAFYLSKKEEIVARAFLETRSYAECARALMKEGYKKDWLTCRRWLEKDHMKGWIVEQMEERGVYAGWTREHFIKVLSDHVTGRNKLGSAELYSMNLIGKYRGYGEIGIMNHGNLQINFHERGS